MPSIYMSWLRFETITVTAMRKTKHIGCRKREDNEWRIQTEINLTAGYLFFLLSVWVALLSVVRMMLQELCYVCHNGFLIWLVYIHIWGGSQMNVITRNIKMRPANNSSTFSLIEENKWIWLLPFKNWHCILKQPSALQITVLFGGYTMLNLMA